MRRADSRRVCMRSIGDAQLARRMVRWGLVCLVALFFALPAASAVADPDTTNPSIVIEQPTNDDTYVTAASTVNLAGSASDDIAVDHVTWSNAANGTSGTATDTESWSASAIPLAAGDNLITVTATDTSSNTATDSITVTRDNTNPSITITDPTADSTYVTAGTTVDLGGNASDNVAVADVSWADSANLTFGSAVGGDPSWSISGIPLNAGENEINVTVTDTAGNTATDTITVTRDNTNPFVSITAPTSDEGYATPDGSVDLGGVSSDNVEVASVTWSNVTTGNSGTTTGTDPTWTVDVIPLNLGDNTITVTATDTAGNSATDTIVVFRDEEDPTVTITDPTGAPTYTKSGASVDLGGTASDNMEVTSVTWSNAANATSGTATAATPGQTIDWSVSSIALDPGDNVITVTATDTAGNTGTDTITVTRPELQLTPAPGALHFGSQEIDAGPTPTQTSTVTNTGTEDASITSVSIGGDQRSQFKRLTGAGDDCGANNPIVASGTCKVRVQFDPSWSGAKSATVTIASNAPDATISLDGTGAQTTFPRSDTPLAGGYLIDGPVNAVAFDSAGRTYIGGAFSSIGQRTGRGVHLTTSSDQSDPAFPDVDGPINAVAPDGSGGWFIGGSFSNVGGTPRANLAHIQSSGALDSGWNPGANDTVNAIAVSGGSVYAGGAFTQAGGQPSLRLAKLSASTGALDTTWTPDPNLPVNALAVAGSNVYVGGSFTAIGGATRNRAARLDAVGVADSWNPDVNGTVAAIALDGTDVYLGGAFTQVASATRNKAAKVTTAGALDPTWNPNASGGDVAALTVSATDVYAGGTFTSIGGQPRNRIARLSKTSGLADTWDPNANGAVNGLGLSGGDVYAVGAFTTIGGQPRNRIARLSSTSGLADSWNPNANGAANAIAIAGSDIYVGGQFTSVGGQTARSRIARLLPDGTIDPDWDPGANNTVNALIVNGSDVFVGGQFTSINGQLRNRLAKLTTADGAAVDPWNPDANGTVFALSLTGTDLYAGGSFTQVSGQTHTRLVKLPSTGAGTADAGWTASATASVLALASDAGFVYAGGSFINLGGQSRFFIGRVAAGGTGAVDAWDPSANSVVNALSLSSTGNDIFAGGAFSTIGGQTRNRLAKLSTSGSGTADMSWDPNANGTVRALAIAGTDIYAGGDFTTVSGRTHGRIVRLATSDGGAADPGWDPAANGSVNSLAATATRLAAGGAFTTAFGQSRQSFALFDLPRLWRDPSTLQFGSQDIDDGQTGIRTSTVRNSGSTSLSISSVTDGGPDSSSFVRVTGLGSDCSSTTVLAPNGTCDVRVRSDPATTGVKSAFVTIAAPGTPDATVGLVGTGTDTNLSRSPASLAFGSRDIDDGPTLVMQSTVTNSGTQTVTLAASNSVVVSGGGSADFTRLDDDPQDCRDGLPLAPAQTCKLRIQFDPTTVGGKSATLTVNSDSAPVTVDLSGTGTQTQLSLSSNDFAFGKKDIDDGATAAQDSTVTNTGTEPVTLASLTPSSSDFQRLTGAGSDCFVSQTLNAGATCHVRAQFDPATVGSKTGSLPITSNAPTVTIALSGTGTQTSLSPAPNSRSFGSKDIDDGATASQASVVTNNGTEDVTISGVDVSTDFTQVTGNSDDCFSAKTLLHAGDTCNLRVAFDPGSVGAKTGTATVHSNAPDASVALDGSGIQTELTLSPTSRAFGNRDIDDGPTGSLSATVTNTGTQAVTLTGINPSGDSGDFPHQSGASECTSSQTLNANDTCTLTYTFDPGTVGGKSATFTVTSNAAPVVLTLTGQGIQTELSRAPTTLAFGGQDVDSGASPTKTSVVTNTGTQQVSITSVTPSGSDPTQFVRLTDLPSDCSSSTVLNANDTCNVRIQFDPSTKGDKTASITVSSNAPSVAIDLTGTGKETRLSRSPASFSFGSKDIDDGATAGQSATITNIGTEDVQLGAVGIVGTDAGDFGRLTGNGDDCAVGTTLHANDTCKVRVVFNPNTVGAKTATARVSANGVDQDVALSGTGIQTELSRSPASLSFGSKDIDEAATAPQTSVVSNSGSENVTFTAIAVPEHFTHLTGQAGDCSTTQLLHAGDTCNLRIAFDPVSVGAKSGSVTVHSNAADVSVAVDGTGIQTQLTPDPPSLSLGSKDIDDGATAAQTATITNTGTEPVSLNGVNQTGSTDFARATGGTNCSMTTTLAATQSCTVSVTFDPSTVGAKSGSTTLTSTQVPDIVISLGGSGIQTELSRAPASIAFGSKGVDEGATAPRTSVVTNSGTQDVTLTG